MTTQTIHSRTMSTAGVRGSTSRTWAGRVLTALPVLFLAFDGVIKVVNVAPVREAMTQLGYAESLAPAIGVLLLTCLALYVAPPTAVLGAVLLTAYLGGAVAAHVRVGNPLLSHTLFPVFVALMLWGGLALRDPRVRALLPLRHEGR